MGLKIICNKCDCNDMWSWRIIKNGVELVEGSKNFKDDVYLICGNCEAIHSLYYDIQNK